MMSKDFSLTHLLLFIKFSRKSLAFLCLCKNLSIIKKPNFILGGWYLKNAPDEGVFVWGYPQGNSLTGYRVGV